MKISKISNLLNPINFMQKVNELIDVARSPLKRSSAYVVGDIVHVYSLPSNLYLECIEAGTTSSFTMPLSTIKNTVLTDGTVKWIVRDKNDVLRNSVETIGSGNAVTGISINNGVLTVDKNYTFDAGSNTNPVYFKNGVPVASRVNWRLQDASSNEYQYHWMLVNVNDNIDYITRDKVACYNYGYNYMNLTNGIKMCWGNVFVQGTTEQIVTLPIAFSNDGFGFQLSDVGGARIPFSGVSVSNTQLRVYVPATYGFSVNYFCYGI